MKNALMAIAALFLLSSCDPTIEGMFNVKYAFMVKGKEANVVVPAGQHKAKIEQASKKKLKVSLVNGKDKLKFNLETKNDVNIPANGSFNISSQELAQDFSVNGVNKTTATDSDLMSGTESCTYQRQEQVCYPSGNTVVCRTEWRTYYGTRQVEYFDRTTTQDIKANFIHLNGGKLGDFAGSRSSVERFYRYQGQCW